MTETHEASREVNTPLDTLLPTLAPGTVTKTMMTSIVLFAMFEV